jgi:hypothetical protein
VNNFEAFYIAHIEIVGVKTVLVKGRAYHDIKIGDVLYWLSSYDERSEVRVIGLNSYGRSLAELSSGMTGDVELLFNDSIDLGELSMLYRKC